MQAKAAKDISNGVMAVIYSFFQPGPVGKVAASRQIQVGFYLTRLD